MIQKMRQMIASVIAIGLIVITLGRCDTNKTGLPTVSEGPNSNGPAVTCHIDEPDERTE
jgi:hypothetical protein